VFQRQGEVVVRHVDAEWRFTGMGFGIVAQVVEPRLRHAARETVGDGGFGRVGHRAAFAQAQVAVVEHGAEVGHAGACVEQGALAQSCIRAGLVEVVVDAFQAHGRERAGGGIRWVPVQLCQGRDVGGGHGLPHGLQEVRSVRRGRGRGQPRGEYQPAARSSDDPVHVRLPPARLWRRV